MATSSPEVLSEGGKAEVPSRRCQKCLRTSDYSHRRTRSITQPRSKSLMRVVNGAGEDRAIARLVLVMGSDGGRANIEFVSRLYEPVSYSRARRNSARPSRCCQTKRKGMLGRISRTRLASDTASIKSGGRPTSNPNPM